MGLLDKIVNFFETLTRASSKVGQALDDLHQRQSVEVAIQSALRPVNSSYKAEITCLRAAFKQAEFDFDTETFKNKSEEHRILFEKNLEKFKKLMDDPEKSTDFTDKSAIFFLTELNIQVEYNNSLIDESTRGLILSGISSGYDKIIREYSEFLSGLTRQFRAQPGFREIFFSRLHKYGGVRIASRVRNFELGIEWKSGKTLVLLSAAAQKRLVNSTVAPFDYGLIPSNLSIMRAAEKKSIPFLVHFTRTRNLESIFRHGLCSVQTLAMSKIAATTNDRLRLDGYPNGISVSIAFPNYKMFYKYRQDEHNEIWAVLLIDPAVIWNRNCAFCQHNAADHRIRERSLSKLRSIESFGGMFEDINGLPSRASQRLFDYDPTDPQAEVLVFESIDPGQIVGVAFDDSRIARAYCHLKQSRRWDVYQKGRGFFSSREVARQVRS